ncbi:MAG TPA: ABC transporter ATP-binding protein [Candidatus Anoxymicrobiaceae bacterium]
MPAIKTEDLRKTYGEGESVVHAVDGINLVMEKGEFVAIIGPSGSGKSTLLNLLGCLDLPSEGHVFIDGEDTAALSLKELTRVRRQKIGFVFQEFNLLPVLNALENVELPLRYLGVKTKERAARSMEALHEVDLVNRAKNRPSQMSGGERQRVAIARALVTRPALVLADEPTGELDTTNTCKVIELMRKLNDELQQTFAVVTHDPMVASYARRVVSLRDGQLVSDEPQDAAPISCA